MPARRDRWIAVAAAAALVVVVTAVLVTRRDDGASVPADTTPSPTTRASTTTVQAPDASYPWYTLVGAGVVPGPVEYEPCCQTFPEPTGFLVAWASPVGPLDGLLLLQEIPGSSVADVVFSDDAYRRTLADGTVLVFDSYALTPERERELADQVVPGSGLPWILPDPSMELVAFGQAGVHEWLTQTYTVDGTALTLSVGDYQGQLATLGAAASPESVVAVDIDGNAGFRVIQANGAAVVVWPAGDTGKWATLVVPPALADRADEFATMIVPATEPPRIEALRRFIDLVEQYRFRLDEARTPATAP